MTTARNRAIDRIRRDRTLANKSRLLELPEALEEPVDETVFPDERLDLLFTCCHPALATEALALGRALAELMPDEPEAYGLRPAGDDAAARRSPRRGPEDYRYLHATRGRRPPAICG